MLQTLKWFLPALLPALLMLVVVYFSDRNREPLRIVLGTFALGLCFGVAALALEERVAQWTGLSALEGRAAQAGTLVFLFGWVAPFREAAKVAATWPAFLSKHFDEPYDGLVYSASSALGFATIELGLVLRAHPHSGIWFARALLALPANVFFACAWGYALGRAKQNEGAGPVFPASWLVATILHGLYLYLLFGRSDATILLTLPLVLSMAAVVVLVARDLRIRKPVSARDGAPRETRLSLPGYSAVPSFQTVRRALQRTDEPLRVRWIVFGAFVTVGAMTLGFAGATALGRWLHIDFSLVSEKDASTAAPVALLGSGLLAAFPLSGYLIAKATRASSLLEPAIASALAIALTLITLGVTGAVALLLGLSCSPIAWGLSCAGAWVARTPGRALARRHE